MPSICRHLTNVSRKCTSACASCAHKGSLVPSTVSKLPSRDFCTVDNHKGEQGGVDDEAQKLRKKIDELRELKRQMDELDKKYERYFSVEYALNFARKGGSDSTDEDEEGGSDSTPRDLEIPAPELSSDDDVDNDHHHHHHHQAPKPNQSSNTEDTSVYSDDYSPPEESSSGLSSSDDYDD